MGRCSQSAALCAAANALEIPRFHAKNFVKVLFSLRGLTLLE